VKENNMTRLTSWVSSANSAETPFPLNNLPYGVFSTEGGPRRLGVALGDQIIDVAKLADVLPVDAAILSDPRGWNGLMDQDASVWQAFRADLTAAMSEGAAVRDDVLVPQADATLHMPFTVMEFTDFYAGKQYQPLGPFQAKATATSISPWIVTAEALNPFRCETPAREKPLLPHLQDTGPMLYDIALSVTLNGEQIARTNYNEMYYSTWR